MSIIPRTDFTHRKYAHTDQRVCAGCSRSARRRGCGSSAMRHTSTSPGMAPSITVPRVPTSSVSTLLCVCVLCVHVTIAVFIGTALRVLTRRGRRGVRHLLAVQGVRHGGLAGGLCGVPPAAAGAARQGPGHAHHHGAARQPGSRLAPAAARAHRCPSACTSMIFYDAM